VGRFDRRRFVGGMPPQIGTTALRLGIFQTALLGSLRSALTVWADTAYRSEKNEAHLAAHGYTSRIHRKKPKGKPMPKRTARANAAKSEIRARIEHVFARQKGPMALVVRTIGLARARVKIGLANLVYNMKRFVWLNGKAAGA
jgi:transposase, IS5 family